MMSVFEGRGRAYTHHIHKDIIGTSIGSWDKMVNELGNLAWNMISHTWEDILNTIESWSNIITKFGAWTVSQIQSVLTSTANVVSALGNWTWNQITKTYTDICNTLGSWANMINQLGNIAWSYITKTATDILNTISNWGNMITQFGAWTASQISSVLTSWTQMITGLGKYSTDQLDIIPYKLPTSAYNYVVNPSFEYGTWGGNETQSSVYAKHGKYSACLIASGANIMSGFSNFIDIRGYDKISLATWIKVSSLTTGNFYLNIYFYNANKQPLSPDHADWYTQSTTCDWKQVTKTYTPSTDFPSGTCYVRLRFQWWNPNGNPSGTAYIDDFQFNVGDQIPVFQDFTTYSFNWKPEKIETQSTTDYAWSSYDLTNVLQLDFECESTMLIIVLAHAHTDIKNNYSSAQDSYANIRLRLDDSDITETLEYIGIDSLTSGDYFSAPYSAHTVQIVSKGSHNIKMMLGASSVNQTAIVHGRRITIIKGFYQGGTN